MNLRTSGSGVDLHSNVLTIVPSVDGEGFQLYPFKYLQSMGTQFPSQKGKETPAGLQFQLEVDNG